MTVPFIYLLSPSSLLLPLIISSPLLIPYAIFYNSQFFSRKTNLLSFVVFPLFSEIKKKYLEPA